MNSIAIIIFTVCFLFFISGCLLGAALVSTKINELKNRLRKIRTESDQFNEECSWLKKKNDEVISDYKNLYTYYNDIRKQCSSQQTIILQLKKDLNQANLNKTSDYLQSQNSTLQQKISPLHLESEELKKYRPFFKKYLDQISVNNDLRFQIQQLKEKMDRLTTSSSPKITQNKIPIDATIFETSSNISQMFDSLIDFFSSRIFDCGCVISDDMGFVIASSGNNSEELAGVSVLFQYCENIIERNTTFNNMARLCFVNNSNMHLTVFPLITDNIKIYCSGLSSSPLPREIELNHIILPSKKTQIRRSQ